MLRVGALVALSALYAPAIGLGLAGLFAARGDRRRVWRSLTGVAAVSTLCWLVAVGLVQHETPCEAGTTGCPTVYGWSAPLGDDNPIPMLLVLGGVLVPALGAGWRRLAPSTAIGASAIAGPTLLAMGTAPRGDNDGLWVLVFWSLAALGVVAVVVAAVAARAAVTRRDEHQVVARPTTAASATDRFGALFIDVVVVGAALIVPVTAMSNAGAEVAAAVVGITVATLYLAIPTARRGQSLGQRLLGVRVLDAETRAPPPVARAILRSLIVTVEVTAAPTLVLALPALAEVLALSGNGRTLTDRLLRTVVVTSGPA